MVDHTPRHLPGLHPRHSISGMAPDPSELRLQKCDDCGAVYFPPRPFCPECSSRNVSVFAASGEPCTVT